MRGGIPAGVPSPAEVFGGTGVEAGRERRARWRTGGGAHERASGLAEGAGDGADWRRGPPDIVMYVNSPGGSVTAGMAIFDTMRHIRPDVSTVCVGLAARPSFNRV
ncbi:hypothetical protein Taro_023723 [Colocasia esculenta]|uniref:ATP-dependent Clp protease proteolytic subunit n=1 Tax=Colocasia esculenta TaxID=4460 RepID=A0A843VFB9_COLES|nr:hypothetical protein [Colocasia esculenta]